MKAEISRHADHPIDPTFIARWSPRAFNGEPVPEADLAKIFEAARWAPSAYNSQPWRFLYAHSSTPHFEKFLKLLVEFNQSWAKSAGALVILVSKETLQVGEKISPSRTHALDVGTAWGYLALEAVRLGYMSHAMAGIDLARTRTELKIPVATTLKLRSRLASKPTNLSCRKACAIARFQAHAYRKKASSSKANSRPNYPVVREDYLSSAFIG